MCSCVLRGWIGFRTVGSRAFSFRFVHFQQIWHHTRWGVQAKVTTIFLLIKYTQRGERLKIWHISVIFVLLRISTYDIFYPTLLCCACWIFLSCHHVRISALVWSTENINIGREDLWDFNMMIKLSRYQLALWLIFGSI